MSENFQIVYVIILVTVLLVALVFFIIFSVLMYQRAHSQHVGEVAMIKERYEKEIMAVQLEVKDQTLLDISEEIHDNVGQLLSLVSLNLHQEEQPSAFVQESIGLMNHAMKGLRNISHLISTDSQEECSLEDQLQNEIDQINKLGICKGRLIIKTQEYLLLEKHTCIVLIRMVQEVIHNVVKHAQANNVTIVLRELDGGRVELTVEDDGVGFDPMVNDEGIGVKNLYSRAQVIHADLKIDSSIGVGTEVIISFENGKE